jgi:hypothetical protein
VLRSTHTLAELELSPAAYDEIAEKLRDAGYHHAFITDRFVDDTMIDMHGIGITRQSRPANMAPRICKVCHKPEGQPHPYRHMAQYEEVV